ncbi:MAG: NAD-glutamate dehydrogenase [Devosia sp.]
MDAITDTRRALLDRATLLKETEPNFARFLLATTNAADPDDLMLHTAQAVEAMLRQAYGRLGKRGDKSHVIHDRPPDQPGGLEHLEIYSSDMPFVVDSVLAAIRAKGGAIRFIAHPVLHLDPESYRLLDAATPKSVNESLLIVETDPAADADQRAALLAEIDGTLAEVARATKAWRPMLERLQKVIHDWKIDPPKAAQPVVNETAAFLGWLADHNFTFLGMREYRLEGDGKDAVLVPQLSSGLGLLEDPAFKFLRSGTDYVEMTEQHMSFLGDADPLMVTKANVRTRVHRRTYMDYVGVKLTTTHGKVTGELRIIGLFTSMAMATPHTEVPLIRRKVTEVMRRSGLAAGGHAGKSLLAALENYPRDELFQITEDQLFEFAKEIAALPDRPRVRVLPRIDRFDNFVSILVFVPRDRYTSDIREKIGLYLAGIYAGRVSAYYPYFPEEGELVRVHFIIGRDGGATPRPARDELEGAVGDLLLTFGDRLHAAAPAGQNLEPWAKAFSAAYQSRFTAPEALADVAIVERLAGDTSLALKLVARAPGADGSYGLKVYHRGRPIPLSDRVPMLENFGFRVIDERTYTVSPAGQAECFIHDMVLDAPSVPPEEFAARAHLVEDAILAVWQTDAESDGLNALTLKAGLAWDDIGILRALARYLKLVGVVWSRTYLAQVLTAHPDVAKALLELFHTELDMGFARSRERAAAEARAIVAAAREATPSIDEDRIIGRLANLVEAAVRTNAFQRDGAGTRRPALAIKFDCTRVEGLPAPRPYREIYVYSPRVEGVHLRFGPVARGGLRWSDRAEDFRTEVLGLVKAQQVKNAIIVPVGAKGAFVPRMLPIGADRERVMAEGTACYTMFVSTLLDVTDNLEGDVVIPPPDVRCRDGEDPYLVVAADKGTASFSDTANAIALERKYWLGDAFASGGSNGYDHKKMGITARGAWEAVKRHFREMNRDIQASAFTVAGVGDMSGDVFGNGMLLSPQIRLVAAFDHRDIFIDPDPDPRLSLEERKRLFALTRSTWQDYNRDLISKGGGVYPRTTKTVPLADEARRVLGLGPDPVTPLDVMSAILKAKVDLLWFGGIGTYVRGETETDAEAGDKANDGVRITGRQLRAGVVGEGANLAVTQKGRIEYALAGGRIDTDAIDNSAGVNASDIEVNVKIALNTLSRAGILTLSERNRFLADMTDEVAALCLANNYLQTLALSLSERAGIAALPDQRALMETLEARGELDRGVEALPTDAEIEARVAAGRGLTRPELATLLAYAKNTLETDLVLTKAPDDAHLSQEIFRYFPAKLSAKYPDAISAHRLRREVVATVLANQMINRGGPGFAVKMTAATSADAGQVAAAFCLARDAYGLERLYAEIDALDGAVPGKTQLALYAEIGGLVERETLWLLRNADFSKPLDELALNYAEGVTDVQGLIGTALPQSIEAAIAAKAETLAGGGAPAPLARRIAELSALAYATDIVAIARRTSQPVSAATAAFFGVLDLFGLSPVIDAAGQVAPADRYDRMALDRALANLMRAQRDLSADVLGMGRGDIGARLAAWRQLHAETADRVMASVTDLTRGTLTVSRLAVAAGLLSDLAKTS